MGVAHTTIMLVSHVWELLVADHHAFATVIGYVADGTFCMRGEQITWSVEVSLSHIQCQVKPRFQLCLCIYLSVHDALKWHNIVNSQYIAIQFYMRADTPLRYVAIEMWHSPRTRTTALSIANCPIDLKFDTGVSIKKVND